MRRRIFLKSIAYCLAALFLASVFSIFPVKTDAAGENSFFALESADASALSGMTLVENYADENFYPFGSTEIEYGSFRGMSAITASDGDLTSGSFYGVFENTLDLSEFNELCFELRGTSGEEETFDLTVTLSAGGDMWRVNGEFDAGTVYDVYLPLAGYGARGYIDHIYISYTGAGSVTMSGLFADEKYTYSHVGLFCADEFESDYELEVTEDALYVAPRDGAAVVTAKTRELGETGETAVIRVTVDGAESGSVIMSVKSAESEYSDISTLGLFSGPNTYTFICEATEKVSDYRLSFVGVNTPEKGRLAVLGVSFTYYGEKIDETSGQYPGNVTSCALSSDGKSVRVKGTLGSGFVSSHIDDKIGVYAVDMWNDVAPQLVAKTDITTLFDMTFQTSDVALPPYYCRYFIALAGDEETGETVPLTPAVYPSALQTSSPAVDSILGVESDDTADAFDANAAYTSVEIALGDLVSGDPSNGRFHAYAGNYYYFNAEYIKELDSTLGFYISSGLSVYVRLVAESDEEGAVFGCVDADNREELMKYSAAVDYLTERYPGIYGIIVGRKVNSFVYNYIDKGDLLLYAKNYVRVLRVTSLVAKINDPSVIVAVPLGDSHVYSDAGEEVEAEYDETSGVGESACDPVLLSVLISKYMAVGGAFPWYIVYECEADPAENAEWLSRLSARLVQNVGASPSGHILYWRPEGELDADELEALSEKMSASSATLGTKTLLISLRDAESGEKFIPRIKELPFEQSPSRTVVVTSASRGAALTEGHVFIKDFRSAWGSGEFFTGGSFTSATTETSAAASAFDGVEDVRALRVTTDGSGSGIVMARFASPADFSAADTLFVVMALSGEGESYPVKIILGSKGSRTEYSIDAVSGNAFAASCPIDKDTAKAVDYIAIEIPSGCPVTLDVSRISLSRSDRDTAPIEEALGRTAGEKEKEEKQDILRVIVIVSAVSLAVFALVSVRGDLRERRENSRREKK